MSTPTSSAAVCKCALLRMSLLCVTCSEDVCVCSLRGLPLSGLGVGLWDLLLLCPCGIFASLSSVLVRKWFSLADTRAVERLATGC